MPELECVGGPLDGTTRHFFGDEFPYPDDGAPDVFGRSEPATEGRRHGVYVLTWHPSPTTGARRNVWLWQPPRNGTAA